MAAQPTHHLVASFLRAARYAESSRSANVSMLNSWCAFLDDRTVELTAATRADAEEFVDELSARVAAATVTATVSRCRSLHAWLADEGEADTNPWLRIKLPAVHETPVQVLEAADYKRLIRTCDRRSTIARRDEAIMSLLWWSGLRRSEICNLDLAGVDLHHGTATVGSRTFSTKNNKVRRVPLAGETVAALDRYLRRRGVEDGPLFLSSRGDDHEDRRLQPNSITTMVNYRAQRAGIDRRIGIHEFRRATGNRRSGLPRSATSRRPPPPRTLRRARRGCLGPGPGRDLRRCCASSPLAPRGCGTSAAPGQPTSSHAHHIPQRAPRRSASVPPLASAIKVTPRFIYPQPLNTTERG